eukprot:TRINITY_DN531_c0_g1_i1.p1 TRINITY_DN531_c0_g1~~TRINITY_DN531_c0_g1_i1.p1  ORF type:complete len:203 (-),score=34.49 TRINITY_DN531_c0_g1_i1:250-858(-)
MAKCFAVSLFLLMSTGRGGDTVGATTMHFAYKLRGNTIVPTRSRGELQKTFLTTGCTNREAYIIEQWKLKMDLVVLSDMFELCSLNAEGRASETQRSECCGDGATEATCKPSCQKQNSIWAIRSNDELQKTFIATGCINREAGIFEAWQALTDEYVLGDMFTYCKLNAAGQASDFQRMQCCGANVPAQMCKPKCSLQRHFLS